MQVNEHILALVPEIHFQRNKVLSEAGQKRLSEIEVS